MAIPTRDVRLKRRIKGVLTELLPETRADLVLYGDTNVAAKMDEVLELLEDAQGIPGPPGEIDPADLERITNLENTVGTLNDALAARLAGVV